MTAVVDGSVPLELALQADSKANHALEEVRELRRDVAERNSDVRDRIDALGRQIAEMHGEQAGEAKSTRRLIKFAVALAPAAGVGVPHLLRVLGIHL